MHMNVLCLFKHICIRILLVETYRDGQPYSCHSQLKVLRGTLYVLVPDGHEGNSVLGGGRKCCLLATG